ncbi:hypothetical protein BN8_02863 [Fibrisoma limi BUZ 3]|uniref:STAS/SEC14 domain-containing protein n=1 Tax=Fibrisoma limi BUZ 3 TaxID=1185876 RepID=I2GIL7_9BACT|nr:hypothetical protein [Fibrisoma limi]CCH53742.1 hypothetical protein BN8_02863 [Fibrisoma limi BUZ 3]
MKMYQNDHVVVAVEYHAHLLQQVWQGLPSSENYREASLVSLQLAEKHHLSRWLIDQQQLRQFNPMDLQWFTQQWLPEAIYRLPARVRIAVVLTDLNQFNKLGSDLVLRAAFDMNPAIASRYFLDTASARAWLSTPHPSP